MSVKRQVKRSMNRNDTYLILFLIILFKMLFPLDGLRAAEKPLPIPLMKAIEIGIQQDSRYKNQLLSESMAHTNRIRATLKKYFNLDLGGSYLYKSETMEITFFPGRIIEAGAKNNYDIKVALTQPLFTGNILANSIKMEAEKEKAETSKTEMLKIELAGRIKTSYFTCRLLENKKKTLEVLAENIRLHLKRLHALYAEEQIKKSDVIETEMQLAETNMTIEDLNRALTEEKINFKKLSTLDIDAIEPTYTESAIGSMDEALSFFKTQHPVLHSMNQNIQFLVLRKRISSGAYLPQINGFAEIHYGKPGIDFFKNKWSLYFQGGIGVNLKLFDWNQLKYEHAIADKSMEQVNNQKTDLIAEAEKNLAQLYSRKASLENQLETLENLMRAAAENASLKEDLYKESQISNIDYLSALLTRERYESLKEEKSVEYQLVKTNINTVIGRTGQSGEGHE
ncbi:MAG: TolC family protein [Candidatus Omnitrophota bacterium]